ncbi:uncharacterized protein LOC136067511 [Quercus suber]|uniref:uncharacterized protein LOC136067511 n=1 Tax=Quercus suber TaxID=58331 RepID=UPI0032DE9A60
MNSLCWNCRGIGNPQSVYSLRDYVRRWTPYIIFLVETKAKQKCMEKIKFKLSFSNGLIVLSLGKSGGLALLWSKDIKLEIKSYSQHHIDATITEHESNFTWRFTGFFGHSESHLRKESWKLLSYLNTQFSLPWFCCGDFNEILSFFEKSGGPYRAQRQKEGFWDAVKVCGFQDLGFSGPQFTWCNMCEGNDRVYLRLDKAFANTDRLNMFHNCRVHHVVDSTSNHCILRVTDSRAPPLSQKRHFHFKALWARCEDCYGIVKAAWNRGSPSNTLGDIAANRNLCAFELSKWSKEVYGNIPRRI